MKATISMESLWLTIQSLSISNQKWLSGKLIENIREEEEYISKKELLAGIDAGLKEVRETREGKLKAKTAREFLYEL